MTTYIVKYNGEIGLKQFGEVDNISTGLTADMCLNVDEIISDIITNRLSEDDRLYFKGCSDGDLSMEHCGFGMWIRNSYALWQPSNPLTELNAKFDSEIHPDYLSKKIMNLVQDTLNHKYFPCEDNNEKFNDAMKTLGG